jgi:hypothetical protein
MAIGEGLRLAQQFSFNVDPEVAPKYGCRGGSETLPYEFV